MTTPVGVEGGGAATFVRSNVAGLATPLAEARTWYDPGVALAVNCGEVATPSLPVVAVAVVAPPAKAPPAPLAGAVNVTTTPLAGLPEASTALAESFAANAVPTVALWPLPAVALSAAGVTAGVYSTTSCAGLAPCLLEYCLRLVDVPFISKLNVPLPRT